MAATVAAVVAVGAVVALARAKQHKTDCQWQSPRAVARRWIHTRLVLASSASFFEPMCDLLLKILLSF